MLFWQMMNGLYLWLDDVTKGVGTDGWCTGSLKNIFSIMCCQICLLIVDSTCVKYLGGQPDFCSFFIFSICGNCSREIYIEKIWLSGHEKRSSNRIFRKYCCSSKPWIWCMNIVHQNTALEMKKWSKYTHQTVLEWSQACKIRKLEGSIWLPHGHIAVIVSRGL